MPLAIPFDNPATYPGHSGVDFGKPRGTAIRASGPGRVGERWSNSRGGNLFAVHYDGYPPVYYAHLDNYNGVPGNGARVNEGDLIGHVGNTGNSTGPHLHMEVEGRATTDGFWSIFSSRVVGGGSTAGGGGGSIYDQWGGEPWVKGIQDKLNRTGYGPLDVDGIPGPLTEDAISRFQRDFGLDVDGVAGPQTNAKLDERLRPVPGSGGYPVFPLPAGYYFGPAEGPAESISGQYSYPGAFTPWQQQMLDRGWTITPDGIYGPESAAVASAFQAEKGLTVDGLVGPETWKSAWLAPVTPPVTSPPVTPPVTPPVVPPVTGGPSVPSDGYVPTQDENPRGLPVVPRTYPGAKYALQAPLGDGIRGWKGVPPVPVELVVDMAIEHWTGVDALQYDWFSYRNSRSSCPHLYILANGDVVEFIPFEAKPATTGPEWNWRSYSWEIQKVAGGAGTPEQFEAVARVLAWLHSLDGTTYRGIPVRFKLDRASFKNHRECLPGTECPGQWWHDRMDLQLARAREIFDLEYNTPEPPVEPEEPVEDGKLEVDRAAIVELNEVARGIVTWTDEVLK